MYSKPPSNFDALLIFGTVGAYRVGHCIITNLITRNNQKYSISLRFTGVQHLEGREALVAFETDSLQEASQMDDAIHEVLSKLCLATAQACVHRRTLRRSSTLRYAGFLVVISLWGQPVDDVRHTGWVWLIETQRSFAAVNAPSQRMLARLFTAGFARRPR